MQHIVCFSGGHSSAIVALAVCGRYGRESVTLLNHNINPGKEAPDIKRFKLEVSAYLQIPITYANIQGIEAEEELPDQFQVSLALGAFKQPGTGTYFCTHELKTKPFNQYLAEHWPPGSATIYYGFDDDEQDRIERRARILGRQGYATAFPIADWPGIIEDTRSIGIQPPSTYAVYKHGNCAGCLKGGIQHWYVTYCHRPDVYAQASATEEELGYTINRNRADLGATAYPLSELAVKFARMKLAGVPASEHVPTAKFQHYLKRFKLPKVDMFTGCECQNLLGPQK